jgi:hypothetical protein
VVAELVRSGSHEAAAARAPGNEHARAVPAEAERADAPPQVAVPPGSGPKPSIGAWMHLSSRADNAIYGGAGGIDWRKSRVQVELGFAYGERARGSITSGLAAARYRHCLQLTGSGSVALKAGLSSAAGVTWAIGESRVPGVVVRRALFPYADARVELSLELWPAASVSPELAVYSGGAAGLLSTDAGQGVLSSGGWLLGAGIGSTF